MKWDGGELNWLPPPSKKIILKKPSFIRVKAKLVIVARNKSLSHPTKMQI